MAGEQKDEGRDLDFLLKDEPDRWPQAWRDARGDGDPPMPRGMDDSILAAMGAALEEEPEEPHAEIAEKEVEESTDESRVVPFPRRRAMWFSAAAMLLLAPIVYIIYQFNRVPPSPLRLVASVGDVRLKTFDGGSAGVARPGTGLSAGSILDAKDGTTIYLRFENDLAFRLAGPGRFAIRMVDSRERALEVFVEQGTIAVHGESAGRRIVWSTKRTRYRMLGTTARLDVGEAGEKLRVSKGAIRASRGDSQSRDVAAGRSLDVASNRDDLPETRTLTETDRRELDELKTDLRAKVPRVAPGKGQSPASTSPPARAKPPPAKAKLVKKKKRIRRPKLHTLEELRGKYGSIQVIRLKNGRRIVGHMRFQGDFIIIYTEYGPLRVKRSLFREAREY